MSEVRAHASPSPVSISELRDRIVAQASPHFPDAPDVEVSPSELLALLDAVEAAHRWQLTARGIVSGGIAESGYCAAAVHEIAGALELERFKFADRPERT